MKTIKSFLICSIVLFTFQINAQISGGFGFLDISYASVNEDFVDASSEAFTPELQLNESGIGIGASGIFLISNFAVGGGGGAATINSNDANVGFNVGHGYGILGYNLSKSDDLIIIPALRIGGFGNTIKVNADSDETYSFGNANMTDGEFVFTSGAFSYGIEVDVLKMFPVVPGLVVGLSGYFNAPISTIYWSQDDVQLDDVEEGAYSFVGVTLKIGYGGLWSY